MLFSFLKKMDVVSSDKSIVFLFILKRILGSPSPPDHPSSGDGEYEKSIFFTDLFSLILDAVKAIRWAEI